MSNQTESNVLFAIKCIKLYQGWKGIKKCKANILANTQNNTSESTNDDGTTEYQAITYPWSHSDTSILLIAINSLYDEIVFCRKDLILLNAGYASKKYIHLYSL